ncbi:MAG: hypothetical protein ACM31C_03415 [Acidobacteriota bacterium]
MRAATLALVLAPALAHADATVTVTLTPAGQQLAQNLGYTSDAELVQRVNDKITSYYQTTRIPQLMTAFADTTAFADRDLGVAYANDPGQIVVGAVATAAIDSDATFASSSHAYNGEVVNFAVMAGAGLARWGLPRWSVFGNAFYASDRLNALDGHLTTTAAHVQYRILDGQRTGDVRWLGLSATAGLEYARWTLGIAAPIKYAFTVQGDAAGTSRNLTLTSTGTLSLVANTLSMPLEVTTGVRFLGHVALYAGGGLDVAVGDSTLTAGLAGDMTITSDGTDVGHVTITASGSQQPTPITVHALGGVQVDLPHFQIYAQALAAPSITAAQVGTRVVF